MSGFKNVIEDIVVKISQDQLNFLRADLKQQINLTEVAAYALNRLPPLYVTTQYGWVHQHNRALEELIPDISNHVRRAIQALQIGDPLHDHTPLPEDELSSKARSLVMLSKLLDRENLRWRDLPGAVFTATQKKQPEKPIVYDETLFQEKIKHLSVGKRSAVMDIKGYLNRSKQRIERSNVHKLSWAEAVKAADGLSLEDEELDSYVLKAQMGYSNVLEKLVVLVAEHLMRNVPPAISSQIDMSEIVAFALNRLPPMYVTSDRGYKLSRQRAQSELTKEITAQVRQAILKVGRSPKRMMPPLPLQKFEQEHEEALAELRRILHRPDITSQNVVEIVEALLESK